MEATSAPRPHGLRMPRPRRLLAALSDERLVEHVRGGDATAFEVLYDRYSAGILGFCRHMLGSLVDAEDAVQHTFIAAHSDIQRHDRRELHVKAWLYTIARNRCLSMLRARREHPSEHASEIVTDNLLHDVEQREAVRALLADVTRLPDDQREALVLSEIGDLSHRDIGAVLGCEVSKVKSLVFQARSALVDRRVARDTPCAEIREQLATLRGGALRRSPLRHHLDACPGCSAYREEIRRQRAMLALALPVVPSAALRANVLGGLGIGGSTAVAGAGAGAASGIGLAAQGGLAKLGVVAALAAGGAGGATVANNGHVPLLQPAPTAHESTVVPVRATRAVLERGTSTAVTAAKQAAAGKHTVTGSRRSARGSERGFTPVPGESNGARARAFAQTRGKGEQISAQRHATANARTKTQKPARSRTRATPTHPVRTPKTPSTKNTTTAPKPAPEPKKAPPAPTTTPTPTPAPQAQASPPAPSPDTTGLAGTPGKSLSTGKRGTSAG